MGKHTVVVISLYNLEDNMNSRLFFMEYKF